MENEQKVKKDRSPLSKLLTGKSVIRLIKSIIKIASMDTAIV